MSIGLTRERIAEAQRALWETLPHADREQPHACCWACGDTRETPERAHLLARAHGGDDKPTNLILLCRLCHAEHPDSLRVEAQLLWLRSHESLLERQARELERVVPALRGIATDAELAAYMALGQVVEGRRLASGRAHTLFSNASWALVSDFLEWKAGQPPSP